MTGQPGIVWEPRGQADPFPHTLGRRGCDCGVTHPPTWRPNDPPQGDAYTAWRNGYDTGVEHSAEVLRAAHWTNAALLVKTLRLEPLRGQERTG